MRKVLITMLAAAALSGGMAFAQSWAGVSLGFPTVQGYFGMEDTLGEGIDVRGRLGLFPYFGGGFSLGADALFELTTFGDLEEFSVYAGGGPALHYWFYGVGVDVSGIIGIDYDIDDSTSLFAETGVGVGYYGGFGVQPRGALGINFSF